MEGKIARLKGCAQHYAWGGYDYIPDLLNINNKVQLRYAEYWMGAHPSASCQVMADNENWEPLQELIEKDPLSYLGNETYKEFGELPYLFKILDVREILSIQVHPSKEEAIKGFEREEAEGIPITAQHRNYKDRNHKPEIMVALSEFYLLHGFKPKAAFEETLQSVPEFNFLLDTWKNESYYGVYKQVMEMDQQQVDQLLLPLVQREIGRGEVEKIDPAYWVQKLYKDGPAVNNLDKGIFSIYFFNIVKVLPGQGVFQAAGLPHAYLEGQNVELMANSDNVLRGGLTPKHIDVPELLKHTVFEETIPNVLDGTSNEYGVIEYPAPVKDFGIVGIELLKDQVLQLHSASAEIIIVIEGEVLVEEAGNFKKGDSFFIKPAVAYQLQATENTLMYKAFVPAASTL